jgi:hypothetical protein
MDQTTHPLPFDAFREDLLVKQWHQDMSRRKRIREDQRWRGNISFALLIDDLDKGIQAGDRYLYPNEEVRGARLCDLPKHVFPGVKSLDTRNVNYASIVQADISRYNVPLFDFGQAQQNWNFRFEPFSSKQTKSRGKVRLVQAGRDTVHAKTYAREFATFNLMSAAMTNWAYTAVDAKGRPFRKPWFNKRPADAEPRQYRFSDVHRAFPNAVLGFSDEQAQNLYWPATESPNHSVTDIKDRRFMESGDFVGVCPSCGTERKYHLADTVNSKSRRRFTREFKYKFCKDVAKRLPVYAPCDVRYDGRGNTGDDGLTTHNFVREDGQPFTLRMLPSMNVTAKPGSVIEYGELIATLLPKSKNMAAWSKRRLDEKWATLHTVVPRKSLIPVLRRQWFEFQGFRIPGEEGYKFWDADLVTPASRSVAPTKLYWDLQPCADADLVDMNTNSVILPPVSLKGWNDLQFTANQITVLGDINDRRFRFSPERRVARQAVSA